MNKTETKAKDWLKSQGKVAVFQHRVSPDFVCEDGRGYEVKLLRSNSITFTIGQFATLKKFKATLSILVYNGGDTPVHIIPFAEIKKVQYWRGIRVIIYVQEKLTKRKGEKKSA